MPFWTPDTRWAGQDVFVVGGGPSLSDFDWALLEDKPTIGVNSAFRLGVAVIKVAFFSDEQFWTVFEDELEVFATQGDVVTHCHPLLPRQVPYLKHLTRFPAGLHRDGLGFGYNSGCGAVNLALLMGARRVFLLGFDCKRPSPEKTHWHNWAFEKPSDQELAYRNFLKGWSAVALDLPQVFPGCEIINLNPDSAINFFPKAPVRDYLSHAENLRQCS